MFHLGRLLLRGQRDEARLGWTACLQTATAVFLREADAMLREMGVAARYGESRRQGA